MRVSQRGLYLAMPVANCGMRSLFLAAILLFASPAIAEATNWRVCFTPGGDCTGLVVETIQSAQHSIRVQAYSFTSVPILAF
jgi:phospholipase D